MSYTFYQILWTFLFYSFLGWFIEVVVFAIKEKKFVNRGFLNGPLCPIYGFGVLSVLAVVTPFKDNIFLLFVVSIILTTTLEFLVGFILEKSFHQKWWDYADKRFNFLGYISLDTSLAWGALCVLMVYTIQPALIASVDFIPYGIGATFLWLAFISISIDLVFTMATLMKIRKNMALLEMINKQIEAISSMIGHGIADNTIALVKITEDNMREIERLSKKRQLLANKKVLGYQRLTNAFPELRKKFTKIITRHNKQ